MPFRSSAGTNVKRSGKGGWALDTTGGDDYTRDLEAWGQRALTKDSEKASIARSSSSGMELESRAQLASATITTDRTEMGAWPCRSFPDSNAELPDPSQNPSLLLGLPKRRLAAHENRLPMGRSPFGTAAGDRRPRRAGRRRARARRSAHRCRRTRGTGGGVGIANRPRIDPAGRTVPRSRSPIQATASRHRRTWRGGRGCGMIASNRCSTRSG
jgi:hypothetical protein